MMWVLTVAVASLLLLLLTRRYQPQKDPQQNQLPTYRSQRLWWLPAIASHSYDLIFSRTEQTMAAVYARLGSAFHMTTIMGRAVLVSGPDLARWAFGTERKCHEMVPAAHWLALMGPRSLAGLHGEQHRRLRKCLAGAFTAQALADYNDAMVVATRQFLDRLVAQSADGGPAVDVYLPTKQFTMDMALRIIFSADSRSDVRLGTIVADFVEWFGGLGTVFPYDLPFTALRRGMQARQRIIHAISLFYRQRLADDDNSSNTADMLQQLMAVRDEDDQPLQEEQLCDVILGFLFAGHDATMGALCSTLYAMDRVVSADSYQRLRSEVNQAFPPGDDSTSLFDYATLSRLPYLDAFSKELLRVYGPLMSLSRTVIADCEMPVTSARGKAVTYQPPVGTQFVVDLKHAAHDERYYDRPFEFCPERFLAPRQEDKQAPFTFIPFGSGPRMCIGAPLVRQELKLFLATLVHGRGYRIRVESAKEHAFPVMYFQPTLRVEVGSQVSE